jgi:hypothetical protein
MKKSIFAVTIFSALASSLATAGIPVSPPPIPATVVTTGSGGTKSDTKAYAGLNWTLGGGMTPALVLGVFSTKVKSNGDTTGANLAFHLNLAGGIKPSKLKLSYLDGEEKLQGELGVGYDFIRVKPLAFLGLNAPYIAVGVDGYLNPGLVPYLTVHSQGKFDKPTATSSSYSCPSTTVYDPVSDSFVPYALSGTTCNPVLPPAP